MEEELKKNEMVVTAKINIGRLCCEEKDFEDHLKDEIISSVASRLMEMDSYKKIVDEANKRIDAMIIDKVEKEIDSTLQSVLSTEVSPTNAWGERQKPMSIRQRVKSMFLSNMDDKKIKDAIESSLRNTRDGVEREVKEKVSNLISQIRNNSDAAILKSLASKIVNDNELRQFLLSEK